ncbi:hypothetical protein N0V94_005676 [Neodidymelliopsis sp. IMI 364377]|nr:hypothetical protein N0V94_005676 [Neodidymelliopsis sp. IMI 364377]
MSASSGAGLTTHIIQVGGPNGSLAFYPNNVKANAGDMVQFQFHPKKNHSVVQSTFDNPCVPIQNIMSNKTDAFYSGFMPTNTPINSTSQLLTYTIRVSDNKPIWFYCSQGKHCQEGMVGAINAPESGDKTMNAFTALAANAAENLSPGQAAGSSTGSGSGTGTTSPSSGSSGSPTLGSGASGTSTSPAQNTANSAPVLSSQSFFSLGAAAMAAIALW